jgi:hypothetical protein
MALRHRGSDLGNCRFTPLVAGPSRLAVSFHRASAAVPKASLLGLRD